MCKVLPSAERSDSTAQCGRGGLRRWAKSMFNGMCSVVLVVVRWLCGVVRWWVGVNRLGARDPRGGKWDSKQLRGWEEV